MNTIRNILGLALKPSQQLLANTTDLAPNNSPYRALASFNAFYFEALAFWNSTSEHPALLEGAVAADDSYNSLPDFSNATLDQLEHMLLYTPAHSSIAKQQQRPNTVFVELLWDTESDTNNSINELTGTVDRCRSLPLTQ